MVNQPAVRIRIQVKKNCCRGEINRLIYLVGEGVLGLGNLFDALGSNYQLPLII